VSYWTVENQQFLLQMSLPYYTGICLVVRLMMCSDGLTSPLYAFTLCDGWILPRHGKYGGM